MKILAIFIIFFLTGVVLLSLAITLTSATADLAKGNTFATASTVLLTSRCITGFMVLVVIVAGIGASFGWANPLFKNWG